MKSLLIILIFSLSYSSIADDLLVTSKKMSYKLKIDDESLEFKSMRAHIIVSKNQCNKEAFTFFHKKLKAQLKKKVLTKKISESVQLTYKDKSYLLSDNSKLASYLYRMNKTVQAIKIKEGVKCE